MATFVVQLLPRAPDKKWPDAIRLLSQPQVRTSDGTPLDARDTDRNWHAKLVLATTGLHLAQFRHKHRLGDPKQTSGGTGSSDLARQVRFVSDQLALGIQASRKPYLPQQLDDLPLSTNVLPDDLPAGDGDTDGVTEAPRSGGKPAATVPLSADAAGVPLVQALIHIVGKLSLRWHTAGDLDACAGERAPHDCVSCCQSGPERPLVYQPLIPHTLTASYHLAAATGL